jgi:hypothetical protein
MSDPGRDPATDLALLDALAASSELTEVEVDELSERIDESMHRRRYSTR